MNEMYNKIEKVPELIEMLTVLSDGINANLSPRRKTTLIENVYPESAAFVINEVIRYLQSMIDGKPVETSSFKLTYTCEGCKFYDVVNATDEQTAFNYLCWITDANDDLHFVKAEICDELPSYWCPVGWIKPKPEDVDTHIAWYRSLMKSLEVAGITQHDYYTPELDKVMRSLGYTVSNVISGSDDVFDVFNGKYIKYTRQNHYTLRVKIKEDK